MKKLKHKRKPSGPMYRSVIVPVVVKNPIVLDSWLRSRGHNSTSVSYYFFLSGVSRTRAVKEDNHFKPITCLS